MQFIHIIITIGFRQNRCSGNRKIFSISFYHSSMRQILILFKTIPINQQMLGTNFQLIHSTMHCQKRRIKDIYLIYLFRSHYTYSPCQCFPFHNLSQRITLMLRQLLGIIQQFILKIYR